MTRKPVFSFIDDDEPEIVYCPFCEKPPLNLKVRLIERYDYDDNQPLPTDHDQWMQCPTNGRHLIPLYNIKEELDYGPIVDVIDNPFDSGTEILAVDKRTKKGKKKRNRLQETEDTDVQAEHGKVNILYDSTGSY